jgi:hypothetical protein
MSTMRRTTVDSVRGGNLSGQGRRAALSIGVAVAIGGMATSAVADPYLTYPGTKGRGMGTAFTAVADDISAVWYNPAGIGLQQSSVVLEYSDAPTATTATFAEDFGTGGEFAVGGSEIIAFGADDSRVFAAGVFSTEGVGAFGFYYYEPYSLDINVSTFATVGETDVVSRIDANLVEDIAIFGGVWSQTWGSFSLGLGVEYVAVDDSSTIAVDGVDQGDSFNEEDGWAASLGGLWNVYEPSDGDYNPLSLKGWSYNLGAVYRTSSNNDLANDLSGIVDENLRGDIVFKKPSSWDLGAAAETEFMVGKSLSVLTLSLQYGEIDYENASDAFPVVYEKVAFGGNYALKFAGDSVLDQLDFRAGYYTESVSESSNDRQFVSGLFPETSGLTLGIGAKLSSWVFDLSAEFRELDSRKGLCAEVRDQFEGETGIRPFECESEQSEAFDDTFLQFSVRYVWDS